MQGKKTEWNEFFQSLRWHVISDKIGRNAVDTNEGNIKKYLLLFLQHHALTQRHTHRLQALMSLGRHGCQVGTAVPHALSWFTVDAPSWMPAGFSQSSSTQFSKYSFNTISFTRLPFNLPLELTASYRVLIKLSFGALWCRAIKVCLVS